MSEVKVKSNLKLFPWQHQVIFNLKEHWKGYTHVVKSKRQCGKSIMLESILISTAIDKPRTTSICLSPTLEQARKVYNEVKKIIQPTKVYSKHNDLSLYIIFSNGSVVYFKSAEQRESLRGYTVSGVYCIDEAAYISDEIFYITLPWVNVSQAPVVIVSTPNFKTGFFYKYYTMGMSSESNNVYSYDWSTFDTSATLPPEKLEEYRKSLSATKFKTEYLGLFLDNEGGVFGDYGGVIRTSYADTGKCYFGIDWGSGEGQDETAIVVFNDKKEMMAIYHFNDKDETQTINYIIELIKKHKPLKIQVEGNSIGQVFYGLLDKAIKANGLKVQLIKFITTNESKERIINRFQVAIQNNEVTILNDNALTVELDMYEMKPTPNGKRTYNAHNGYHDDIIIAMLLAFNCISSGTYHIL